MKLSKRKKEVLLYLGIFLIVLFGIILPTSYSIPNNTAQTENFTYLSDIPYIEESSSAGWGEITLNNNLDKNVNGGLISLLVDGKQKYFLKGISAHANSTLVYNISDYNYDYFTSYIGVDSGRGSNGNGVKFYIYTSEDGENWNLATEERPQVLKGDSNAIFVKIDIRNKKYLKLMANNNGNATADHSVYANAKLIKDGYVEDTSVVDFIHTVEEYDEIIRNTELNDQLTSNELVVLQRYFVQNVGYELLQVYAKESDENKEAIKWLMNDVENLRDYVTGGRPIGNYANSFKLFLELYKNYKDDLKVEGTTESGVPLKVLYRKLMLSISLTHSSTIYAWYGGAQASNPIKRYEVYKTMYQKGILENPVFETLEMEEMRWVVNNQITDEELEWLNAYARRFPVTSGSRKAPYNREPYIHIRYTFGYNYSRPQYYEEANMASWDAKYDLNKYNVKNETGKPKLWIVFEEGAVCGGTSKTGSNLNAAFGYPSAVIGQPGHAAYLEYFQTEDGKGMWGIQNNISGWTASEKSERLLLGWGSNNWDSYYQVSYVPYAQEAINDIKNYEKAKETTLLADTYQNDVVKQEQIYRKALEIQSINMDAWYGLIRTFQSNENKTEQDYYELAEYLADSMKFYPLPMWDLLNLIKTKFTTPEYQVKYTLLEKSTLERGTRATADDGLLQPGITVTMANYLLGHNDFSIASFSFDGDKAGKIVLADRFSGSTVNWEYSLDGKNTWKQTQEHEIELTSEEINSINEDDDIVIHLVGASTDDNYTIDIRTQNAPTALFNNDLENKVIGATDAMQWRYTEKDDWTSFKEREPNLTGNKTVSVRVGKTGIFLASPSVTLTYTKDTDNEERKYVSISHLSLHSVSTQATANQGSATNALDGNYNTRWHSAWNGSDTQRFISVKLDEPMYISAVEFVPAGGGNGKIYDGTIYGSMDGENWEVLTEKKNLRYTNQANTNADAIINTKSFDIRNPKEVQYVKIVADRTNGNWFTARAFNFYEDTTMKIVPTAEIEYSTKEQTTTPVTAKLINPSTSITITNNNNSDTYVFNENGEFTFEFQDEKGRRGTATAKVDWIIKKENPKEEPTEPEKPSSPKPTTPNRPNISVPNVIKPLRDTIEKPAQNIMNNKKTYTDSENKVMVTLPDNLITKEEILKVRKRTLSSTLQEEIGKKYENDYFEVYFETKESQKHELTNTVVEITIQLDSTKQLQNVYTLDENGTLKKLSYKKVGTNKITLITTKLGKYILSYKTEEIDKNVEMKKDNLKVENSLQKNKKISKEQAPKLVITIITIVVLVCIIILIMRKKQKEEIEVI